MAADHSEYQHRNHKEGLNYVNCAVAGEPRITRVELRTTNADNVQLHGEPMEIHFEISSPVAVTGASVLGGGTAQRLETTRDFC